MIKRLSKPLLNYCRTHRIASQCRHYSAEHQITTVSLLSQTATDHINITGYGPLGFTLNDGTKFIGPSAMFPRSVLHWNVKDAVSLNKASVSFFTMMEPKPDILILGVGNKAQKELVQPSLIDYIRQHNITVEVHATGSAIAMFNTLVSEGRFVVAALIPPQSGGYSGNTVLQKRILDKIALNDEVLAIEQSRKES